MSQSFIDQFTKDCRTLKRTRGLYMPNDLVVVRNKDADEAGDYRVMRHCEAVVDPQWEVTDLDPADLD